VNDLERRQRRLDRAWVAIRVELFIALAVPVVTGFMFVASPGFTGGGMVAYEPSLIERVVPWAGVLLYVLGLVWMLRLSRPKVEAGERDWRYRDF
jgi:hypothetical protein